MSSLDEVWDWYQRTKLVFQFASKLSTDWHRLPEDLAAFRDDRFKQIDGLLLEQWSTQGSEGLDELAVVRMFASFEAMIRLRLVRDVESESVRLSHPLLRSAAKDLVDQVSRGSLAKVLTSLGAIDRRLADRVGHIRRYRNWITHGKRPAAGERFRSLEPRYAYDTLRKFLETFDSQSGIAAPGERP